MICHFIILMKPLLLPVNILQGQDCLLYTSENIVCVYFDPAQNEVSIFLKYCTVPLGDWSLTVWGRMVVSSPRVQ